MISTIDQALQTEKDMPSFGRECAAVLFLRRLILDEDREQAAGVIGTFAGEVEGVTNELVRCGFIATQNEAIVAELIKRTVRRTQLKVNGLSGGNLKRILRINSANAHRLLKGLRSLSPEHVKTLSAQLPGRTRFFVV